MGRHGTQKGAVNYTTLDNILAWARQKGIAMRGHCIFWGVPNHVQDWLKALSDPEFKIAVAQRGRSIAARYRDQFVEYDFNNEMMHANYYEQRFGLEFTRQMALWVKDGDPNARLFVNDYDVLTGNRLADYVKHIQRLLDAGVPISGIGAQGHLHGDSFDAAALQNASIPWHSSSCPFASPSSTSPASTRNTTPATAGPRCRQRKSRPRPRP